MIYATQNTSQDSLALVRMVLQMMGTEGAVVPAILKTRVFDVIDEAKSIASSAPGVDKQLKHKESVTLALEILGENDLLDCLNSINSEEQLNINTAKILLRYINQ
jgi:hypothetical protein